MTSLHQQKPRFKVLALYKFASLPDCADLAHNLDVYCRDQGIRGTFILAPEGINGTVAGLDRAIDNLVDWLFASGPFQNRLDGAQFKFSTAIDMPFLRLKVRLKNEIVTLRAPEANPVKNCGTYVQPQDWNDLISADDVVVLDTRNDYEYAIGSFQGAIDPDIKNFTQFKKFVADNLDPKRDKKIAMFCTGGIRCEKASSYMLAEGFQEVFHLQGGILKYLETIPADRSKWNGECFVFDARVSIGHGLSEGEATLCHACRFPLTNKERAHSDYIEGIQCRHCSGPEFEKTRNAAAERQKQMNLAKERGLVHLGDEAVSSVRARQKKSA